jgi:preprotein translocase subunit SecF
MAVTLAVISLLDVKLGTAGIAAFLMLIGYSVDTDILLSTRVLRGKEGSVYDRIKSAISTGLLMNVTTLVAIIVALTITQSEIIAQIMTILLVGLLVDVINTWIQNAGILRWYAEKKN